MDKSHFSESSSDPETDSGEDDEDDEDDSDDHMVIDTTIQNAEQIVKNAVRPANHIIQTKRNDENKARNAKKAKNSQLSMKVKETTTQLRKISTVKRENKSPLSQHKVKEEVMDVEHDESFQSSGSNDLKVDIKEEKPTFGGFSRRKTSSAKSLLTGRGVTTQMLIEEEILEPGEKCLTINYLGRNFIGDLNCDGTIKCHNANQVFSSPSAWAMNCKKEVNPGKKSGCGWASVKYRGRKLDEFKTTWFRKQTLARAVANSEEDNSPVKEGSFTEGNLNFNYYPDPSETNTGSSFDSSAVGCGDSQQTGSKKRSTRSTSSLKHSLLQPDRLNNRLYKLIICLKPQRQDYLMKLEFRIMLLFACTNDSDPATLVECAQFHSTGRIQPFSVTVSTSALLLIDFHSHLSVTEVTGYLCGTWDSSRQHIRISQVYPGCYPVEATPEDVDAVEKKVKEAIVEKELKLLGWYHSHPFFQPDPTIRDIGYQLQYQEMLRDGHYEPCVGFIVSPYESYKPETQFNAYWVKKSLEEGEYGLPLSVRFTTFQDQILTQELIDQMVMLVNFYCGTPDVVKFNELWDSRTTFLEKLKHSLIRKFPQDQIDGRFLDFIHKMLMAACT